MRFIQTSIMLFLLALCASAASLPNLKFPEVSVRSESGQFTATGPRTTIQRRVFEVSEHNQLLKVHTSLLPMMSENVSKGVFSILKTEEPWKHRIILKVDPDLPPNSDIVVITYQVVKQHSYKVIVPEYVDRRKLTKALVNVTLKEYAHRDFQGTPCELPLWLLEGMTTLLTKTSTRPLVYEPRSLQDIRRSPPQFGSGKLMGDALQSARDHLAQYQAMTFEQFDLRHDVILTPKEWEHVAHCTHLFIDRLFALPGGPSKLSLFLKRLPHYYNWQIAFLNVWSTQFQSVLDVEKWWTLERIQFVEKDSRHRLSMLSAIEKLEQIVATPIQLRPLEPNTAPPPAYPLQIMLDVADYRQQQVALYEIISHLRHLHHQVPPDLSRLVTDYAEALATYMAKRDKERNKNSDDRRNFGSPSYKRILRDTLNQLTALDLIREDIKTMQLTTN